jgi:HTH-type transcriptional regulator, global nitrogen regulator NrpRI
MRENNQRLQTSILKILKKARKPLGSTRITTELALSGIETKERTVRFHLHRMDEQGFTRKVSKRNGRSITENGLAELDGIGETGRLGFVFSKIDGLCCNIGYDLETAAGTVALNYSLISLSDLHAAVGHLEAAFRAGLGMGRLMLLKAPGEEIGGRHVPDGMAGIGTVCSVTLNGILLKAGIPVQSRYGCLLRMDNGQPVCFTEMMDYLSTTVDPLEIYIRAGMTGVGSAARGGSGLIGASFREVSASTESGVESVRGKLDRLGLAGIIAMGKPDQPLLNIPVRPGMIGVAIVGGLNPIAAVNEAGIQTRSEAMHCLVEAQTLHDFEELRPRADALTKTLFTLNPNRCEHPTL